LRSFLRNRWRAQRQLLQDLGATFDGFEIVFTAMSSK